MTAIREVAEPGLVELSLGVSYCRLLLVQGVPPTPTTISIGSEHLPAVVEVSASWTLTFHKGLVELEHLREEGLDEAAARQKATTWLDNEHGRAIEFQGRRGRRVDRLEGAAAKRRGAAEAASETANRIGERFYMGQPIIVDHHSTRKARSDQAKMHGAMRKSLDLSTEADELAARARAAAGNTAISSDDPDAIGALSAKLADLLARQALLKKVRKATLKAQKANDRPAEAAILMSPELGLSPAEQREFASYPVEPYMLTNISARIRDVEKRIADLRDAAARPPPPPEQIGDVEIREEENRVRVFFPRIPPQAVRDYLDGRSFHWSPTVGAWQRMPGSNPGLVWEFARDAARMLMESVT